MTTQPESVHVFHLTRHNLLALEAVLDIAHNGRGKPVCARELAERHGIRRRYLEQALQQLVHDGLLKGLRGPRGGYSLARERRRVTLGDVLRSVTRCERETAGPNSDLGKAVLGPICEEVAGHALTRLDKLTMEELCRRANKAGFKLGEGVPDFNI